MTYTALFELTDAQIVLMTDPAVAFLPDDKDYAPYHRGKDLDVYLKAENGSDFLAIVWPGTPFCLVLILTRRQRIYCYRRDSLSRYVWISLISHLVLT